MTYPIVVDDTDGGLSPPYGLLSANSRLLKTGKQLLFLSRELVIGQKPLCLQVA